MTEIQEARRELAILAAAMRGWDPEHTMSAMLAAKNAGWDFALVSREVFRLLLLEDGEPAGLRNLVRNATARAGIPAPTDYPSAAAQAREALMRRHDDPDAA
jgi:hypothetical protein